MHLSFSGPILSNEQDELLMIGFQLIVMKKIVTPSKVERILKADPNDEENIWLTRQKTLRSFIGILGILLPVLLYVFLRIDSGYNKPLESISHYYYTRVSSILVITVSLLAIFLIIYKGRGHLDIILSTVAGVFALCVILFPTDNISIICADPEFPYSVTLLRVSKFRELFHYISAAIFLSSLAYMSLFQFTQSDLPKEERTGNKKVRNFICSICGIIMVLALMVIAGSEFFDLIPEPYYSVHHLTFWMEVVALESFGISWLTKAKVIIGD
jgi:hypothetical protein